MAEITELKDGDVMRHLRESIRDLEFTEWVLVATTTDEMTYVGYSPPDMDRAFWMLHKGATIVQDLDIPEEPFDEGA
jgi:hypothetical protein